MALSEKSKNERVGIRVSHSQKHLLQEAAKASHKSMSDFLLESAIVAAEQVLTDRRIFLLDEHQWESFQKVLDRPVKPKAKLKQLLAQKSILD